MSERLSPRVVRGAALLDVQEPGWENEIDCERLNLADTCDCVLGQIYGGFDVGLLILDGEAADSPERFGFADFERRPNYRELTRQWRLAVARRKGEA